MGFMHEYGWTIDETADAEIDFLLDMELVRAKTLNDCDDKSPVKFIDEIL